MSHWEFQIELYCSAIIHSFARNSTNSLLHAVDFSLRYYSGLPATCTVFLNKLKIEHGSTKASIFKNLHAVVKAWLCRFSIEWSAFLMSRAKPWKRRSSAGANGDVAGGFLRSTISITDGHRYRGDQHRCSLAFTAGVQYTTATVVCLRSMLSKENRFANSCMRRTPIYRALIYLHTTRLPAIPRSSAYGSPSWNDFLLL